jgi:hypothetical protein
MLSLSRPESLPSPSSSALSGVHARNSKLSVKGPSFRRLTLEAGFVVSSTVEGRLSFCRDFGTSFSARGFFPVTRASMSGKSSSSLQIVVDFANRGIVANYDFGPFTDRN